MTRLTTRAAGLRIGAVVAAVALLASCGNSSSDSDDTGGSPQSSSAAPSSSSEEPAKREYFGDAESDELNEVISALHKKQQAATDEAAVGDCWADYTPNPRAWRTCVRGLLAPVTKGYERVATTADGMARPELGQKCSDAIATFSATLRNHATAVNDLIAAYDTDRRAEHDAASDIYYKTVDPDLDKAIIALSKGCYSKKTLERAKASASATESAKP